MEEILNQTMLDGRIISVHKHSCTIRCGQEEYSAGLAGSLRAAGEVPVVGDFAEAEIDEYGSAVIRTIKPRKTCFTRPDRKGHAEGYVKTMKEQPVIANYDYVFIITSLNHDFNVNRIARYAAVTLLGGGMPVAVLTKADLAADAESYVARVREIHPFMDVMAVSAYTGEGLDSLTKYFQPGVTIALLGSSGAGKSTLMNTLLGKEIMDVGGIRESDSRGRHTTTYRQMVELDGIWLIDTPGMREIGMCGVEEGVDETFEDIALLADCCRFSDCTHDTEPGCAIKAALAEGRLSKERWQMYISLQRESGWAAGLKRQDVDRIRREKHKEISKKRKALKKHR